MKKINHVQICRELVEKHDVLRDLIGKNPFHFVDVPVHGNIGDLLIMLGTLAFFDKINIKPRLMSPFFSFRPEWVKSDESIVFQGGGNFGDLYPPCHLLREHIAVSKPQNRIIILPQSIHFSSDLALEQSAQRFRTHPDLHLCVRDTASYELAKKFTDNVYLLPDMAHQLYPLAGKSAVRPRGVLSISRVDDEKRIDSSLPEMAANFQTDWPALVGNREITISYFRKVCNRLGKWKLGVPANQIMMPLWVRYSKMLTGDAVNLFASHTEIISDRLHGHILAFVMSLPCTLLDNSYQKNSRYAAAWTGKSELVKGYPANSNGERT